MTANKTYGVTEAQRVACTRVIDEQTQEVHYIVASASDPEKTYIVRFCASHKCLSCTCPAMNPPSDEQGQFKYAPRICWHVKAVVQHNRRYHEARKAEARQEEQEMLERVQNAKPANCSEEAIKRDLKRYAPRPFSILR